VPLQADVWKSTSLGEPPWVRGVFQPLGNGNTCGASCSAAGVDRQWTAASIRNPSTETTANAEVVLMYHDFYGPSSIWVNISTDGGANFAASKSIFTGPDFTVNGVTGEVTAQFYTFCSTVPAGVAIVPPGLPHAGRIIVGWIAADPGTDLSGCNLTMAAPFHTLWVAYSDNNGSTWTPQQAFDGGVGHDASTPFVGFTLDNQGNPYFSFAMNHWDADAVTNAANIANCAQLSASGPSTTLQQHPECEYDMYVVWSADGGATWTHGSDTGGTIPRSAGVPFRVNPTGETGTHWFPAVAAGDPGKVDVAYLLTPTIEPIDAAGKVLPGGCAGPSTQRPNFPPACVWNLYGGQSLNADLSTATATWTTSNLTAPTPMHTGDICNLGIACVGGRTLSDFIQETVDPTTGCAHVAYADNQVSTNQKLRVANQTSGPSVLSAVNGGVCGAQVVVPVAPWAILLIPAGLAAGAGMTWRRRRAKRLTAAA